MNEENKKNIQAQEGLTAGEVIMLQQKFGLNKIPDEQPQKIKIFFLRFWGLIPLMLELSVVLDALLGRYVEAVVMLALLIFNAIIGFIHEQRAHEALSLLRTHLRVTARVRRDGMWGEVVATDIVPGDFIELRVGDITPADVRIIEGLIEVDQSQLTGESLPLACTEGDAVYAGSEVSRGEAMGIVIAIGTETYFGKTAELVRTAKTPPQLEKLVLRVTKYLAALVITLVIAVCISAIIYDIPLRDILPFVLILLVSAVPVTLPMMFTLSAALGARALTEQGILITRLSAIEDVASMDVLCLDKTGTLTENRLTLGRILAIGNETEEEVLRLAVLASHESSRDAIDLAILEGSREKEVQYDVTAVRDYIPFHPTTKRSEVTLEENGQVSHIIKGAPVVLAELAHLPWEGISKEVAQLSVDGSRVIAIAKGVHNNFTLVGLLAFGDPARTDSRAFVTSLYERGIRVILITGDGEATANAIAIQVGIAGDVAPKGTLKEDMDINTIIHTNIFSGVLPQDKYFLIKALQKAGHVVGMTGDGVNDAPALRQAEVGIAVLGATDVARASASVVLTGEGLNEIVIAIDEGRRIYERIQTWILAMMIRKSVIPPFLTILLIFFNTFALNPLLIVLLIFATDISTMSISTDRVAPAILPRVWNTRALVLRMIVPATFLLVFSVGIYVYATQSRVYSMEQVQTIIFCWLVFASAQATLYLVRAQKFFWIKPHPGTWLLVTSIFNIGIVTLMASRGFLMEKISLTLIFSILLLAFVYLVIADIIKVLFIDLWSHRKS